MKIVDKFKSRFYVGRQMTLFDIWNEIAMPIATFIYVIICFVIVYMSVHKNPKTDLVYCISTISIIVFCFLGGFLSMKYDGKVIFTIGKRKKDYEDDLQ